jgi:hypothetical protein
LFLSYLRNKKIRTNQIIDFYFPVNILLFINGKTRHHPLRQHIIMTIFLNAFHSPIGAHSSFTLGCKGAKGGMSIEGDRPADQNVYIGLEQHANHDHDRHFKAFPFFEGSEDDDASLYDHSNSSADTKPTISPFADKDIQRTYECGVDRWSAPDLSFNIYSPVQPAPDPDKSSIEEQKMAYAPCILVEIEVDNSKGAQERKAFFGLQGNGSNDSMRWFEEHGMKGIIKGQDYGIFSQNVNVTPAQGFNAERVLNVTEEINYKEGLGGTGVMIMKVPAGQKQTFSFSLNFYRAGMVTTGLHCSYWYTRLFSNLEQVALYSLENFDAIKKWTLDSDAMLNEGHLSEEQRFHLIHSIRSYYGSTQFLDHDSKPLWVVNEGQYRMMNTFDLTVDQVFFELKMNPWTVKNELDLFLDHYSYQDEIHQPNDPQLFEGGLSFTHDMGCRNHFSRKGYSSYERAGLTGCFSYMTHEQLVNWVLCAGLYHHQTQDDSWLKANIKTLELCFTSLIQRDNPDQNKRNGVMGYDSNRTNHGAEITTYDSLDISLGQARNNVYIAVKTWASYLALERIFSSFQQGDLAKGAKQQAERCAKTISTSLNAEGFIPAIMGEDCHSQIIPAIEGLVFPKEMGLDSALEQDGHYGELIQTLKTHFISVFKKGVCIYDDDGWKLSNTADNSWLSKIYLCQHVARSILNIKTPATSIDADKAHQNWLLKEENVYWAWSDQMTSGVAMGSKYYPRGVTSILWINE